jgi:hypothetical protein
MLTSAYVSILQHTSAYVGIRQHSASRSYGSEAYDLANSCTLSASDPPERDPHPPLSRPPPFPSLHATSSALIGASRSSTAELVWVGAASAAGSGAGGCGEGEEAGRCVSVSICTFVQAAESVFCTFVPGTASEFVLLY